MHLGVVGLNHKTAPIEVREKVAVPEGTLGTGLRALLCLPVFQEGVLLSTCNRTEIYFVSDQPTGALFPQVSSFLKGSASFPEDEFRGYCYEYENERAVNHLFRVACGLDSMILGEAQIMGQVRTAFQLSQSVKGTRAILNTLFNRALHTGGRTRSETRIGERPVSVSHAAVQLAKNIFGKDLNRHPVLIVGAGKMSRFSVELLKRFGAESIFVANRSYERAGELTELVKGEAVPFDRLSDVLSQVDVVISSTSAAQPIISYETVRCVMPLRKERPLFFIDIAVPRDVEPRVGTLDNVFLYDIDDLKAVVSDNIKYREQEVPRVELIISEEAKKFWKWYLARQALQFASEETLVSLA